MSYPELAYQIALTMIPDIGSITARKLIAYAGSARSVFCEKKHILLKIPGVGERVTGQLKKANLMDEAMEEIRYIDRNKISPLYFKDPGYPERLNLCEDGPILLYMQGIDCLSENKILSIVGTREATPYGREVCKEIISGLSVTYPELVIVSGLAYGIDITAHLAALKNNLKTIAVLGHGLATLYPSGHRPIAKKIIEQGALATDFHSGIKPERNNFLRRNRIIAGLSDATLVIESGEKGGALVTADIASSYHRDVLALPGRINDYKSAGCNRLIKNNVAALIESGSDIERMLNWSAETRVSSRKPAIRVPLSDEERRILLAIRDEPEILPELLSNRTGIPIHTVMSRLLEMELQGWIYARPGNRYSLQMLLPET